MGVFIKLSNLGNKGNGKLFFILFGFFFVVLGLFMLYVVPSAFLFTSFSSALVGSIPIAVLTLLGWIILSNSFIDYKKVHENKSIIKYIPNSPKIGVKNLLIIISTLFFIMINTLIFLVIRPDVAENKSQEELIEQIDQMYDSRNKTIENILNSQNDKQN